MTSRDLVYRAIAHQTADRIPFCIGLAQDMREKLKAERGVTDENAYFDNDVIRIFPPWWRWKDLDASFYRAELPTRRVTVWGQGSYGDFHAEAERWHTAGKYVVACIYGSFFEMAYWARGMENFLADMLTEPEHTVRFLEDMLRRNLVMLENILWCPQVDGVLLGSDWGSQADLIMSPATWREFIRPYEQREYDLIKSYGKHVWVHSCGNIVKVIPDLIKMGVDVLNPVQPECMDLAMLKREFGKDLTFWGGLSTQRTLPYGSPADVRREAREVKAILGAGGGHIFAPAQELQADVPLGNVEALLGAAQEAVR
jgi:uroporphyrinogen decarboxylase